MIQCFNRIKTYSGVITFPATKAAGALTIQSNEIYDFENSGFGPLEISLRALDDSKITDTLTINLYVSYDGGVTYLLAGTYADLANGSGDAVAAVASAIKYAPRVRIDADFNASGALAADHGCGVDIRIEESDPFDRRIIGADVGNLGATLANSTVVIGDSVYVADMLYNLKKVVVSSYCADASKVTDNVTWKVQSSIDGTNWFDASTAQANIANGTGAIFSELEVETKLGKYVRVVTTSDGSGALAADHGVQFNIVALF